jgi:hypothetical protein
MDFTQERQRNEEPKISEVAAHLVGHKSARAKQRLPDHVHTAYRYDVLLQCPELRHILADNMKFYPAVIRASYSSLEEALAGALGAEDEDCWETFPTRLRMGAKQS